MKTRKRETRITAAPAITGKRGWVFCLLGALLLTMMSTPAKAQCTAQNTAFPVSYTHLTLPTNREV